MVGDGIGCKSAGFTVHWARVALTLIVGCLDIAGVQARLWALWPYTLESPVDIYARLALAAVVLINGTFINILTTVDLCVEEVSRGAGTAVRAGRVDALMDTYTVLAIELE